MPDFKVTNPRVRVGDPGLLYQSNGEERVALNGSVISDAPAHGTGQCEKDCDMQGAHDWLIAEGVLEIAEAAEPKPKKGGR